MELQDSFYKGNLWAFLRFRGFWIYQVSSARTVGLLEFSEEEGLLRGEFLYILIVSFRRGFISGNYLYIFGF